ncbi:hypothetical protein SAMN05216241_10146 [Limimonas halophila]|uniref:DUF721 domain-containing protein n=1 Tax=Limimonas halophila TaxID=1082479 RepID=A0A1G7KZT0_9PROT|nr:DUF721 domain-containing protein [Limimonas halophila]SDF42259.1 hypothetical protein SAMN05216241_10146 [Limimonas halophila]
MSDTKSSKDGANARGVNDRRRGTLRALAPEVQRVARSKLGKHSLAEASLLTEWPSVVGADIARMAVPRGIRFPNRNQRREGTLELRVAAAHATRLKHQEPLVVERVNAFFGYKAVASLRLLHDGRLDRKAAQDRATEQATERDTAEAATSSPETERRVTQQVEHVADPELREALARLGRTLGGGD